MSAGSLRAFHVFGQDFSAYVAKIWAIPVLTLDEERALTHRWVHDLDVEAAQKLVTSHLRLVVKVAVRFRHYGLPIMDLISEGTIGLLKAVKNFDITLGCRVSTYALWLITAAIKDYVVKSWSVVKIGTGSAKRRLFFNLKKMKRKLLAAEGRDALTSEEVSRIASELKVSKKDVIEMDALFSNKPIALEDPIGLDSDGSAASSLVVGDLVPSGDIDQESAVIELQERDRLWSTVRGILNSLDDRCRDVFIRRRLSEEKATLEGLSEQYGVSKERIRQIEKRAEAKLREGLASFMPDSRRVLIEKG